MLTGIRTINIQPAPGVQLDSVDGQYRLVVSISHLGQSGVPGSEQVGNSLSSPDTQLLHFNGTLRFGALDTTFTSIDNHPASGGTVPGLHVITVLGVDDQSGSIDGLPGVTYGDDLDHRDCVRRPPGRRAGRAKNEPLQKSRQGIWNRSN